MILSEEEIKPFTDLQTRRENLIIGFGQIEYQIQELINIKNSLIKNLENIKEQEFTLSNDFESKHGKGSLNLETREFTLID